MALYRWRVSCCNVAAVMTAGYAPGMAREEDYARRVGIALETIRSYRRMSQSDLARRAETSESTVSRYEAGRTSKVEALLLLAFADALDVPEELLIHPAEDRDEVLYALAVRLGERRASRPELP